MAIPRRAGEPLFAGHCKSTEFQSVFEGCVPDPGSVEKSARPSGSARAAELIDGLCVFITNHVEQRERGYALPDHNSPQASRDKTEIEDAFKDMKSFLKIRPFFVNTHTEKHVQAVFTICVLAYPINKILARRREAIDGKDYLGSYQFHEPSRSCRSVSLKDPETGTNTTEIIPPSKETRTLLSRPGLASLVQDPMESQRKTGDAKPQGLTIPILAPG